MFLFRARKNILTAPFLDAQELHSWSTSKANVCICFYIFLKKFLFQRRSKVLSGKVWDGGKANDFLKAARRQLAVWVANILHFFILIEIFENSAVSVFRYFIYSIKTLKFSIQGYDCGYISHKKSLSLNIKQYEKNITNQTWDHSKSMPLA